MMIRRSASSAVAAFSLMLSLALPGAAHSEWRADAMEALPVSGEIHLGLFNNGERDGFMRLGWQKETNRLTIYDRSMLPSLEIYETQETAVSLPGFSPEFIKLRFHQGAAIHNMNVAFPDNSVRGERRSELPGQEDRVTQVDIKDTPEDTTLRILSFVLPLVLSQENGASASYHWYAPLGNVVEQVTLTAHDGGKVDTPAGAFDTVRFELRGGSPENDIYVTRGENPRIVQIDVLGQPYQFRALPKPAPQ